MLIVIVRLCAPTSMPILEETGQLPSITEDWLARMLFTDRREAILLFCRYLNGNPPHKQVLYYYGEGGNGKSLLLLHLREHYCKVLQPDNWAYVLSDFEGEKQLDQLKEAQNTQVVPYSFIDFGDKPSGDERPQEEWSALLKMRRDLSGKGFLFPTYDYACLLYLLKGLKRSKADALKSFPTDEAGFLGDLADAVQAKVRASLIISAVGAAFKKKEKELSLFWAKRKLSEAQIERLNQLDPERELYRELPRLFAGDLNASMKLANAPQRVVLFFDTHESFWGVNERKFARLKFFECDEWFRLLLGSLSLESGIVAVVAGRRHPVTTLRWPKATKHRIPADYIDACWVSHLATADAEWFVERAHELVAEFKEHPISGEMRRHLISYASVNENEVHPFHLGLCMDIVRAATRQGQQLTPTDFPQGELYEQKTQHLIDKLRKWVDADTAIAIDALGACRSFNQAIFNHLGETLRFENTAAAFRRLTEFSFVWRTETDDGIKYRIHDLMRRLLRDLNNENTAGADEVLEAYHRSQYEAGHTFSIAEAIYHLVQIEPVAGVQEWVTNFEKALRYSRYDLCRTFLEVRNDILPPSDFELGQMSRLEGRYYGSLSKYKEAKQEYEESIAAYDNVLRLTPDHVAAHNDRGIALMNLGELQARLAQHNDAQHSYSAAVAAIENALHLAPDDLAAYTNKGIALRRLGELQAELTQHEDAQQSYAAAITAYEKALHLAPDYVAAHNNKGTALMSLGELQAELTQHEDAQQSYAAGVAAYDEALRLAPDDVMAHNNKGLVLSRLGELQARLAQHNDARQSYAAAVTACDEALRLVPNYVSAHNNKGTVLMRLGELQARLTQHEDAQQSYAAAGAAYGEVLRLAPDDVRAHNNIGIVLLRLGELQAELTQYERAEQSYSVAGAAYDEALRLAPNDVLAHINKGIALMRLGELQAQLAQHNDSLQSHTAAITAYDEALRLAPNFVAAHTNKGTALMMLGKLLAGLAQYEQAKQSYTAAVMAYEKALHLASDDVAAHINKGTVLGRLGRLQAELSENDDAQRSYAAAVAAYDEVLRLAPDDVAAHNNKGTALQRLGKLQAELSENDDAQRSYAAAVAAYDEALRLAPNYVAAHNNKGRALMGLGKLQTGLESYQEARICFSNSLHIAPAQENIGQSIRELDQLLMARKNEENDRLG